MLGQDCQVHSTARRQQHIQKKRYKQDKQWTNKETDAQTMYKRNKRMVADCFQNGLHL